MTTLILLFCGLAALFSAWKIGWRWCACIIEIGEAWGVNTHAIAKVVDAEWRMSEDGKVGVIAIFRPGGRERSKNYIDFLYGKMQAGNEQP